MNDKLQRLIGSLAALNHMHEHIGEGLKVILPEIEQNVTDRTDNNTVGELIHQIEHFLNTQASQKAQVHEVIKSLKENLYK